jgi:hypothetical protein
MLLLVMHFFNFRIVFKIFNCADKAVTTKLIKVKLPVKKVLQGLSQIFSNNFWVQNGHEKVPRGQLWN